MLLGAGLLAAPAISLHMPLRGDKEVSNEQTTFRVMTFNVAGFEVESASLRYILDQDADFVVLQEASTGPVDFADLPQHVDMREELEQKYPYHSQGYHDLAILSKLPYTVYNDTTLRQKMGADAANDAEYHYYAKAFDLQVAGMPLRIINVHLQSIGLNRDDKALYKKCCAPGRSPLSAFRGGKSVVRAASRFCQSFCDIVLLGAEGISDVGCDDGRAGVFRAAFCGGAFLLVRGNVPAGGF